ncbi:ARPC4 domain containing protein [Trichuris trichiura]|uniref:ARPC4 domain containing protein n=1 Tax=Trichuris trichiura TaxID=36087 RepID=A0A077ZQ52_TRITR|nr:ARPC4 domain containing protein [Trichuris trichiura]
MLKHKLVDFVITFMEEIDREISELKLTLKARGRFIAEEFLKRVRDVAEGIIAKYYDTAHYATVTKAVTSMPFVCTRQCVRKGQRHVAKLVEQQQDCVNTCCREEFYSMLKDLLGE